MNVKILLAATLVLGVTACGGGGGGSSTPPINPATSTPTSTPVATATPTTVASLATGRAVNDSGAPIAGATVQLGTGFDPNKGVITGVVGTATTAADGSFSATLSAAPTVIQIDAAAAGAASLHRYATAPLATTTALGTYTLPILSTDETAGIAAYNAARAQYGSGQGAAPRLADADCVLVARVRTAQMAAGGWFAHTAPGQTIAASDVAFQALSGLGILPNGKPYLDGEDLAAMSAVPTGATALGVTGFMGEGPTGGHYMDVISSKIIWVGDAETLTGKPFLGYSATTVSYVAFNTVTL